jgi:putative ABC transport system permease protein
MMRLAYRNLFHNKVRMTISAGGVALALMLILSLDAIFNGVEEQITAYIDNSGADIFVTQSGVRNMHMASSTIPVETIDSVEAVPGVDAVTPIHYLTNMIVLGEERQLAYIIGLPEGAAMGKPWNIVAGDNIPKKGDAIIDQKLASNVGIDLGDKVEIMGRSFNVGGLSQGTESLVNSVAFISIEDFTAIRAAPGSISFLLVKVAPGESYDRVTRDIEAQVPGVTVQTRMEFAANERQVVKDMGTDIIAIMNLVGFLIGLAVMALTVYTAILTRKREYGMLKALGATNRHLYVSVFFQALLSVVLGFGLGLAFTLVLAEGLSRLGSTLVLVINSASLIKVGMLSLIIASLSAALPVRQISGLDPALVYRG